MQCPCCNGKRTKNIEGLVYSCNRCAAVFGSCYKGDLYKYVLLSFENSEEKNDENMRYFDFEVLGSTGVERIHGWQNKDTKYVYQFG